MSEKRFFSSSLSIAGRDVEPVVKGEAATLEKPETERALSETFSQSIAPAKRIHYAEPKHKLTNRNPQTDTAGYVEFRRLCDEIFDELRRIDSFFVGNEVSDEGAEIIVEIEVLLEDLYKCAYGQGESLKRTVVAIQGQINNVRWERRHVEFLMEIVSFLRVRYLVDDATVSSCVEMIKSRGLDPFRGTICEPRVVKRFRIQEVVENVEPNGTAP